MHRQLIFNGQIRCPSAHGPDHLGCKLCPAFGIAAVGILPVIQIAGGKAVQDVSAQHLDHIKAQCLYHRCCLLKMIQNLLNPFQRHLGHIFIHMILFEGFPFAAAASLPDHLAQLRHVIVPQIKLGTHFGSAPVDPVYDAGQVFSPLRRKQRAIHAENGRFHPHVSQVHQCRTAVSDPTQILPLFLPGKAHGGWCHYDPVFQFQGADLDRCQQLLYKTAPFTHDPGCRFASDPHPKVSGYS